MKKVLISLVIFSLIFLIYFFCYTKKRENLIKNGLKVKGVITHVSRGRCGGTYGYTAKFLFETKNGGFIESVSSCNVKKNTKIGDSLIVYYLEDEPQNCLLLNTSD